MDRFWDKVDMTPCGGCWEWGGSIAPSGYGRFWMDGKNRYAHRVAYVLTHGLIPDGLVIDHLCRNTACVNPTHLEPVTNTENLRRGVPGGRSQTHCKRGHELVDGNLYYWERNGKVSRKCRACTLMHARGVRSDF